MPQIEHAGPRRKFPISLRRVRLACGLVLFSYVTLHYANHALGNISVAAMERGLALQKVVWQSAPGAILLYTALTIHLSLGFWALYERRQFRWTRMEAAQLGLGLCIPFLLADHVFGTRVSLSLFGTDKGYAEVLLKFFVRSPFSGFLQTVLLLIVWLHGCIGIYLWLSLKPAFPRLKNLLLSFAVLLPALALLGYAQGGRQTLQSAQDPALAGGALDASARRDAGAERAPARRSHGHARLSRRSARGDLTAPGPSAAGGRTASASSP